MKSFKFATLCLAMLSFTWLSSMANVIKSEPRDKVLNDWLAYIHEQEEKFEMGPENEAIIILGDRCSGKTTLSLLLTDGLMDGIQKLDGSYRFIDPNDRIATGIIPKYQNPVLMVDESSDATYYDWTGFDVSTGLDAELSIKHDILTSYLFRIMAKSSKSLKFVFTLAYSTIDPTEYMGGFLEFVQRATALIKNIDKYRDAIALVVTKVRGQYYSKKIESYDWHREQKQIEGIADYLKSVKNELEMRLKNRGDVYGYTMEEMENMRKFVDILLEQKDGMYQRIGIFQEPQEEVPVKYMTVHQNEKTAIRKMINDNLHFVATHIDDFGYAVSKQTAKYDGYGQLKERLEH